MSISLAIGLFVGGLVMVIYFAEKLVAGVVGSAAGFGLSAFWISVVFIGFDPENLAVGATGSFEQLSGIALGSVVGAAMVAVALALGITALIVPLEFERAPRRILLVPVLAVGLAWGLIVISRLGWSDTLFGMTVLAFLVSVEEIARELPAAFKKRPDITYGNVLGSVLAFFLFNAGLIALVRPVQIDARTQWFYVPVCAATVLLTSVIMATRRVPRWAGGILVAIYVGFVSYGYLR